ncbi:probable cytochrome P450 6d5 [Lutzomyia longipalpis]|uniref:probable cytochrome P450 6d5 n=1 Tax=Lutzomyia longipalpis TaxID=7200 RepID=UPI0024838A52|nr:probable cytochrome P450 6d5 [Lutzomyia longipalpis]
MGLLFDNLFLDVVLLISCIAIALHFYIQHIYSYWDRKKIKSFKPVFPFGNLKDGFLLKKRFSELFVDLYKQTDEPILGLYATTKPALMVCDPELLRLILIRDFQYFHDRGVYMNEDIDPLSGHLFSLSGEKWKNLRAKLTPTFTSGRLKGMMQTFLDCGNSLEAYLMKNANKEVEMRDLMARYTTNIIASVAFGLESDAIAEPKDTFRMMGKKFFDPTFMNILRLTCLFILPHIGKFFNIKSVDNDYEAFIFKMVKDTMNYREKNNVHRKDFMQLLLQLKNTGKVDYSDDWNIQSDGSDKGLSFNELAAQAHVFFLAGFETSSTTMSFCFYELAKNLNVQEKVQREIDEVTKKYDGKITYDSLMEMKYLESCIDEALRMYTPVPVLNRECAKDYKIPGSDIIIEKGTRIFIPAQAIQMDPKYYPEPEEFRPERFSSDNSNGGNQKGVTYMPFGDGPRACIGLRMGKLQAKIGIVLIMSKFNLRLGEKLQNLKELQYEVKSFVPALEGGMNLKVLPRK